MQFLVVDLLQAIDAGDSGGREPKLTAGRQRLPVKLVPHPLDDCVVVCEVRVLVRLDVKPDLALIHARPKRIHRSDVWNLDVQLGPVAQGSVAVGIVVAVDGAAVRGG